MKFMKKNQLAILVIALMLVAAGYLNYTTNDGEGIVSTSANAIIAETSAEENASNIGDATFVSSNDVVFSEENAIVGNTEKDSTETSANTIETSSNQQDDYFTSSKLERDKMYSQMIEAYQKILESSNIAETQKTIATQEIQNINHTKNAISIAENLIKTKGFQDVVIFVNDKSISLIVQAEELEQEQIAQIQNIIARELGAEIENIHISNKS